MQAIPADAYKPCPVKCSEAGQDPWFLFPEAADLASCKETMLLDLVVDVVDDKETPTVLRACTADYDTSSKSMRVAFVADESKASLCTTANKVLEDASILLHHPSSGSGEFSVNHVLSAGRQVKSHLASKKPSCTNNAIAFGYSQSAVVGLFAGAEVHQHGVTADVLDKFLEHVQANSVTKTTVVQLCGVDGRGADYSIGLVASSAKKLDFVQEAVRTWAKGECVSGSSQTGEDWMTVTLRVPAPVEELLHAAKNGTSLKTNGTSSVHIGARSSILSARADCRTTTVQADEGCWAVADRCGISQTVLEGYNRANLCNTLVLGERVCCSSGTLPSTLPPSNSDGTCVTRQVVSGDTCTTLADKCGISGNDFEKANTKTNLCSTLAEGQHVCCSSGDMPDLRPKKDADGNCAVYRTQSDDFCARIAASHQLNVTDLEDFNKNTWGWMGCKTLYPDFNMCVSDGAPPMPATIPVSLFSRCGVFFVLSPLTVDMATKLTYDENRMQFVDRPCLGQSNRLLVPTSAS